HITLHDLLGDPASQPAYNDRNNPFHVELPRLSVSQTDLHFKTHSTKVAVTDTKQVPPLQCARSDIIIFPYQAWSQEGVDEQPPTHDYDREIAHRLCPHCQSWN